MNTIFLDRAVAGSLASGRDVAWQPFDSIQRRLTLKFAHPHERPRSADNIFREFGSLD